jgi:hypothetical protein
VAPKREPPGAPVAGASVVVVFCATDEFDVGVPVEPKREPPGAPVAGASVVVVVWATGAAGVVVVGVGGDVDGTVNDVVVGEVSAAVTGWTTVVVVLETWARWAAFAEPPAKAVTVPPTAPQTTARATTPTTIRCLMNGMLRPPYQPRAN